MSFFLLYLFSSLSKILLHYTTLSVHVASEVVGSFSVSFSTNTNGYNISNCNLYLYRNRNEEIGAGLVHWPRVYECLHGCSEEKDHTGAAKGSSTLFLLLHRVTSLQIWIHKPQGEPVGVLPLQTDDTMTPQHLHHMWNIGITSSMVKFYSNMVCIVAVMYWEISD